MFVRDESFKTFIQRYPVVTFLVALQIAVYLLINFAPFGRSLYVWFAGSNYFIETGEYWRLVTPIITHVSFSHVLFNSFSMVLFAPALEIILGKVRFFAAYLLSGVLANVATFWLMPLDYVHIGASGSIFGLFGIYVYILYNRREYLNRSNRQILLTVLVLSLIMTFMDDRINIAGHLFGLIAGAALGPILVRSPRARK
ncbi:rhomboid family intramembrane serine protease [Fictibacillus aquaticus]|uniref:Rhomboid family intramembrane serine protease n=1 Tax=Fictibacillus aquaticus TaxID=2021314 RepID=A0A235F6G4_9BACL|nr:rhomboid family intramembrane serine protease [Fictibacillus aquaticus]OYD56275.1 rhomboid family intramembrane serine protease [Fictibacillus aquaticus]